MDRYKTIAVVVPRVSRKGLTTGFLYAFAISPVAALADDHGPHRLGTDHLPGYELCAGGLKEDDIPALQKCANEESLFQHRRVNKSYARLVGMTQGNAREDIEDEQRAWLKFRDERCRPGSADPRVILQATNCRAMEAAKRFTELETVTTRQNGSGAQPAAEDEGVVRADSMNAKYALARRADDPDGVRRSYMRCLGVSGGTTGKVAKCVGDEFAYQDRRLNAVYKKLMGSLDLTERAKLRIEERQWIKESERICRPSPNAAVEPHFVCSEAVMKETAKRAAVLEGRLSS